MNAAKRLSWLAGAALWALGTVAQAQAVDEVVVTARDRAGLLEREPSDTVFGLTRPLIETARSASFISDQTLDRFGVQTVDRLTAISPGTYTASFFGVPGALNVRGTLAETYFRGFKRIENRGTYATPVGDASRIEIVRGPPTPIFGAGKVGGLLNLTPITARDQGRFVAEAGGDLTAGLGAYGQRALAATFNTPLRLGDREGGLHVYGQAERGSEYYRGISPNRYNLQVSADVDLNETWSVAGGLMLHRSRGDVQTPGWNRLTQDLIDNGTYITGRDTSLVDRDGPHRAPEALVVHDRVDAAEATQRDDRERAAEAAVAFHQHRIGARPGCRAGRRDARRAATDHQHVGLGNNRNVACRLAHRLGSHGAAS